MGTRIDIVSGFLGAGKTTLINKMLPYMTSAGTVAIVENEFGEIGVDGALLEKSGVSVTEVNGGCICCTLFGSFVSALSKLIDEYGPDRIVIEPTGVGMLSDVVRAVENALRRTSKDAFIGMRACVVDATKYQMYSTLFGDFFTDQISTAEVIFLSRTQLAQTGVLEEVEAKIAEMNPEALIVDARWDDLDSKTAAELAEGSGASAQKTGELREGDGGEHEHDEHEHHHHDDDDDDEDEEAGGFRTISVRDMPPADEGAMSSLLASLSKRSDLGIVVRAKGTFQKPDGSLMSFDFVPGDVKFFTPLKADAAVGFVVIGKELDRSGITAALSESRSAER